MNQIALIGLATLFAWVVGYFYFRWIWLDLRTDTSKLTVFLGPFAKTWNFAAGSLGQRTNATLHWLQLLIRIAIGGPIMLFFMLLLPLAFVRGLWQALSG